MKAIVLSIFSFCGSILLHAQAIITPNGATSPAYMSTVAAVPSAYPSTAPVSYVRTWALRKPVSDPSQVSNSMPANEALMETQYLDGLGRPVQTVAKGVSPLDKDLVTPIIYDVFGREAFKYMPYISAGTDGSFKANAFSEQASFMQTQYGGQGEQFFYGRTDYDASPLNRALKTLAPGNSWIGSERGVGMSYEINDANEVRLWTIDEAAGSLPSSSAYYDAGQLYRTVITDESGKRVVEYKDKAGETVLKKVELVTNAAVASHTGWLCTYNVYDDVNQLRFVLSPKATEAAISSGTISTAVADGLCFRYEYDNRNRLVTKKTPGAAEVWMIYDDRDRLVFTQDGNMRAKGQWLATIYDGLNRTVLTAMMVYTGMRSDLVTYAADPLHTTGAGTVPLQSSGLSANLVLSSRQPGRTLYQATASIDFTPDFESEPTADFVAEIANGSSTSTDLAIEGNPIPATGVSSFTVLTQTYYDDYSRTQKTYTTADNAKLEAGGNLYAESLPGAASAATRGFATGGKVWLMRSAGDLTNGEWLESVSFYDDMARVVQAKSDNDKGGQDVATSRYDFSGKAISTYQVHHNPQSTTPEASVLTLMDYDEQGRLLAIKKKLNGGAVAKTTVQNEYNELGQLKTKHLGTGLQNLAYEYNIRGWLKSMNKDYVEGTSVSGRFGQTLSYDYGFNQAQYNGNIAGLEWRSIGDGEARAYGFAYDNVNRLLKADFTQYTGGWNANVGVDFSMKMGDGLDPSSAYDANGNIRQMWQKGLLLQSSGWIDGLKYTYAEASNQLKNVVDLQNDPSTRLGDFRTSILHPQKTLKEAEASSPGSIDLSTIADYSYDVNGNLAKDLNKDILAANGGEGIVYNYLNLPVQITVQKAGGDKGTITYLYDATGIKHQKVTKELNVSVSYNNTTYTSDLTTTTSYEGGFTYEGKAYANPALSALNTSDQLQFLGQEEGRIRPAADPTVPFVYDYFIKDHLGNVRMVLTEEQKVDAYPAATMEVVNYSTENLFYSNLSSSQSDLPAGYPTDSYTSPNNKVAKLNGGAGGNKIGPAIVLKVMAGDRFDLRVSDWYKLNGSALMAPNPITDLTTILANAIGGVAGAKGTSSEINTSGVLSPGVTSFLSTKIYNNTKPKAYINWIAFDEQFKYDATSSGSHQVGNDNTLNIHQLSSLPVHKNGYLYIFVSNETPNVDVFFDNLQITHIKGPLLEETHYYPFGLVMAAISSKAAGGMENKIKFTSQLFDDELGWNTYQMKFRTHDPQIGRFLQIDPLADKYVHNSTYAYAENDVIRAVDVEGLEKFIVTNNVQMPNSVIITYDPTPVKDLAGNYQVLDTRTGKVYTDAFPEQAMQKNLGGSHVASDGSLYIQPDNSSGLEGNTWDFLVKNPVTSPWQVNSREPTFNDVVIIGDVSEPTPMKTDDRSITKTTTTTMSADQSAEGNFSKSNGTMTHSFNIPGSSTPAQVGVMTDDGGAYHNNFNVTSGGKPLATIRNTGSANVSVPGNSTLKVQVTGIPKAGNDIYSVNLTITTTTTTTTTVTTIDRSKL